MDVLNAFTTSLRVPNISSSAEIVTVLRETNVFNEQQCREVEKKLASRRWVELADTVGAVPEQQRCQLPAGMVLTLCNPKLGPDMIVCSTVLAHGLFHCCNTPLVWNGCFHSDTGSASAHW